VGKSDGKKPLGRSGLDGRIVLKEVIALIHPNLSARWVRVVNAMPLPLYPREEPRYTLERAGWTSGTVWTSYSKDKNHLSRAVKSVASRCTDYAKPAPSCCYTRTENIQAFRGVCSQRVHSADAVRMDSSNSPFSVKLYTHAH